MLLLLTGISGTGKTTIGRILASRTGWAFYDGDDYHSETAKARMAAGVALSDADRAPWLARLNGLLLRLEEEGADAVVACSALRAEHRQALLRGVRTARVVWLEGSPELIRQRLAARQGHFFPAGLLDSQLATAEPPPDVLRCDVAAPPEAIVDAILRALGRDAGALKPLAPRK